MGRLLPAREERLESTRARGKRAPGPRGACCAGRRGWGGGGVEAGRRRGAAGPGKAGRLTVGKDLVHPTEVWALLFPRRPTRGPWSLRNVASFLRFLSQAPQDQIAFLESRFWKGHPLRRASRSLSLLSPDWSLGGDLGSEVPPRCCC